MKKNIAPFHVMVIAVVASFSLLAVGTVLALQRIMPLPGDGSGGIIKKPVGIIKKPPIVPQPVSQVPCSREDMGDTAYLNCEALAESQKIDTFLTNNKAGKLYTPDSREAILTPYSEVVRLLIDTQALGYLNLYDATKNARYLQEAQSRLDYIISQGNLTLRGNGFDGQVGWSMLRAYSVTKNEAYRTWGMKIADACLGYRDTMNVGYMCDLTLGQAYTLTGDTRYLTQARWVTRNTGDKQFTDGAFPHLADKGFGENTGYTEWITYEMINYRRDDPSNPDLNYAVIKAANFLGQRVSSDGSINYQDANGIYWSDGGGNLDCRGWLDGLPSIAYTMHAFGRDDLASKAVDFLIQNELTGTQAGSFPDKWEFTDPNNAWTTGSPSVIRTSLIFMYLTDILRVKSGEVANGSRVACTVTPGNCDPALQEINQCAAGLSGHMTTFDGVTTKCLSEEAMNYRSVNCIVDWSCTYDDDNRESDVRICRNTESIKCAGDACGTFCLDTNPDGRTCDREFEQGDQCLLPPPPY